MKKISIKFWKYDSVRYTFFSIIASGLNLFTSIVFGRIFAVDEFGNISAIQAFLSNVTAVIIPIQVVVCKSIVENNSESQKNIHGAYKIFVWVSLFEIMIYFSCGTLVRQYLNFERLDELLLFIILIELNNIYLVVVGIAQGKQKFDLLGIMGILLYLIKLILGVLLSIRGLGMRAVIISNMVGISFAIILAKNLIIEQNSVWKEKSRFTKDILQNYIWSMILYIMASFYMNNGDILLGKVYCDNDHIGLYYVASSFSKINVFLIATPVATILLPKIAGLIGNRNQQIKLLLKAEVITIMVSIVYEIVWLLICEWCINKMYGENYVDAVKYVFPCTIFSIVLCIYWIYYQYSLGIGEIKYFTVITTICSILSIAIIILVKCELRDIPMYLAIGMIISVIVGIEVNYKSGQKLK